MSLTGRALPLEPKKQRSKKKKKKRKKITPDLRLRGSMQWKHYCQQKRECRFYNSLGLVTQELQIYAELCVLDVQFNMIMRQCLIWQVLK